MEIIVFLDRNTLRADVKRPRFEHQWIEYEKTDAAQVVERLREATIAITNKVPIRREAIENLSQLKMIAVAATGVDILDLEAASERGLVVSNVRGYARAVVPEHVFTLILALRRNLIAYHEDVRRGAWNKAEAFCLLDHPIRELHGSTLGIIGYGSIGRGVEGLARAFGMRVLISEHKGAATTRAGRTSFDEVLGASDVITVHAPLSDETRNMIGAAELKMMKRSALLINCARGGVVDERALAEGLREGVIAGAGVDVLTEEPPREGNSLLELVLPNLIVTPHIAWASLEAMQALADQLIENIEAFQRGEPQNVVSGKR